MHKIDQTNVFMVFARKHTKTYYGRKMGYVTLSTQMNIAA